MKLLFKIFGIFVFLSSISFTLSADELSSPITIGGKSNQTDIGAYIGLGQNMQSGEMFVDCPECVFKSGVGFGYNLGLILESDLFSTFRWGVMGEYNYRGFEANYNEIESTVINYDVEGKDVTEKANIRFSHNADVSLSYFSVAPFLKWDVFKFMFIRTGLDFSFGISSNIIHTKALEQRTLKISTGEIKEIYIGNKRGTREVELQDTELNGFQSFAIGLKPAIGFNIPFSKKVFFSPIFEYYIPFSKISNFSKDLSVSSWRLLFELRIAIRSEKNYK